QEVANPPAYGSSIGQFVTEEPERPGQQLACGLGGQVDPAPDLTVGEAFLEMQANQLANLSRRSFQSARTALTRFVMDRYFGGRLRRGPASVRCNLIRLRVERHFAPDLTLSSDPVGADEVGEFVPQQTLEPEEELDGSSACELVDPFMRVEHGLLDEIRPADLLPEIPRQVPPRIIQQREPEILQHSSPRIVVPEPCTVEELAK